MKAGRIRQGAGHWVCVLAAIGSLTGLEIYAMSKGHDGLLFTLVVGAVAGLAGFNVRRAVGRGDPGAAGGE